MIHSKCAKSREVTIKNACAGKNVCQAYNSTLPLINVSLDDEVSKGSLNPDAKSFSPITDNSIKNSISTEENPPSYDKAAIENNIDADNGDVYSIISKVKIENANKIIIAHLNINSIRNKIDMLSDIVKNKIDILCITETKLDDTFPLSNFLIAGFSPPYRMDRTNKGNKGGGLLAYVRSDIPSKLLKVFPGPSEIECLFFEINLFKKKWILGNFYNPSKHLIDAQLNSLGMCLDHYYQLYDNIILLGDFNSEITEPSMKEFCEIFDLNI